MIALLNGAPFEHQRIREQDELIERARRLVDKVEDLAGRGE
jgi:Cys-tRNA synthase (O-phospho-L-seryl-tRNA:Cys-tRNA synthase)